MRVLIFEPDHTGHHLHHVRALAGAFSDLGTEVTVALDRAAPASREYDVHLGDLCAHVDASMPESEGTPLARAVAAARALAAAVRRHRPDHVLVPYGDGLTQVLGVGRLVAFNPFPRGVEAETLLMRGGFAYPRERRREALRDQVTLSAMALAPWTRIHHLDPLPYDIVQKRGGALARRSRVIPEPVESSPCLDRLEARRQLGVPEDGPYVGCVGMLDGRKGVDRLVRAFVEVAPRLPSARLLLMGRVKAPVDAALAGEGAALVRSGRIVVVDRYVSDEELGTAFSALDLVCTPYPRHIGSSGVVVRAAAAERPLLGSDFGWVGWSIRRFGLGHVCDVREPPAFARALEASLGAAPLFRLGAPARGFVAFHTMANFLAAWTARARERLGLDPEPTGIGWGSVLAEADRASAFDVSPINPGGTGD